MHADPGLVYLLDTHGIHNFHSMHTCKRACGSRSKGPCKEFRCRRPPVLVEVAPRKIRDGVAKVTFFLAKVLRNCIL